jgi:hypothetical protein
MSVSTAARGRSILLSMRRPRAPFVVTVVGALGVGCGSSGVAPQVNDDAATSDTIGLDAGTDGARTDIAIGDVDDKIHPRTPLFPEQTVGDRCTNDRACDPDGSGSNFCSNDGSFSWGTLYPEPVCLGRVCDPGPDLTTGAPCDDGHGVCVATTVLSGVCLPRCTFDDTGAPPVGCPDLNPCSPYAWSTDATGAVHGVGYCNAGCLKDSDCTNGDRCQLDQGYCVTRIFPRTFAVGDPCFSASNPPEVECNCLFAPSGGDGYCTQFCLVDDARTTCPTGFVCTAGLPGATFSKEPKGAVGNCLKSCSNDAECAPLNSKCELTPESQVCVPTVLSATGDAGADAGGG